MIQALPLAGVEYTGGIQSRDGEIRHCLNGCEHIGFIHLFADLANFPGRSGRAQHEVQFLLARLRYWNGDLDSLYGGEDRRKCVEYCKKSVHAPILENVMGDPKGEKSQATENRAD